MAEPTTWSFGDTSVQRVPYFDTPLPPAAVGLDDGSVSLDWAGPWVLDGQPLVGQAFWVIRSGGRTAVVDPCGASDEFLRSGPDAVAHQDAAFECLEAAGCAAAEVDLLLFTHLDGIGMAALADGAAAGEETWRAAFPNAEILISTHEHEMITTAERPPMGTDAFLALDRAGLVRKVDPPEEVMTGVVMHETGAHSAGHCVIEVVGGGDRAVLLGHLAVSPLHAGAAHSPLHVDSAEAQARLEHLLDAAHADGALLMGSLWPTPGAARVAGRGPTVLAPVY